MNKTSTTELLEGVARWIARDPDATTRDELAALRARAQQADADAIEQLQRRFAARLDFGTAGLRGVLGGGPARMNRLVVRETSAGLGRYLLEQIPEAAERGIVLGYDGRRMSDVFAEDAATVFAALGLRVHLGDRPLPTPICAYALASLQAAAAVVITASHNPPEYNGYKVYWENGAQIIAPHDGGIAAAIDAAAQASELPWTDLEAARADGLVSALGDEIIGRYLDAIAELSVHPRRPARAQLQIAYTPLHGVGALYAEEALRRAGFESVHTVASQREPDGAFPTVRFPNPEEPGAMDAVIALAREHDAPLAIANDPDADRLAVAVRDAAGDYRMLSGDQLGVLLGADRIDAAVSAGEGASAAVGRSVVSSQMLGALARARGVVSYETLTGFKWIANVAMLRERERGERFIFGYEEALGYTVGRVVRDKDGISAALCFAELADALDAAGSSVLARLEALYREVGLFLTRQKSLGLDPLAAAEGPSAGDKLRAARPSHIAGRAVQSWADVAVGKRYSAAGDEQPFDLPQSDVLIYWVAGDARVIVRPSGTEPKLKCYYELRSEIGVDETFAAAEQRAREELDALVEQHQAELAAL